MTNNKLKEKSQGGGKACGAFVNIGSTAVVEVLARSGLDAVIIDTEHGPFDVELAEKLVMAAELHGITPLVRAKDASRASVLKLLDIGAMGLVIPFIKSVDEVRQIVAYGKYRPLGDRGYGLTRKNGFGLDPMVADGLEGYFNWSNENTLILPQCETVEALEQIEDIAALPGVGGIFVGPFDLSVSMGLTRQFGHPDFLAALARVLKACKDAGKLCFTLATDPREGREKLEQGFDGVFTCDTLLLAGSTAQYVKGLRE